MIWALVESLTSVAEYPPNPLTEGMIWEAELFFSHNAISSHETGHRPSLSVGRASMNAAFKSREPYIQRVCGGVCVRQSGIVSKLLTFGWSKADLSSILIDLM